MSNDLYDFIPPQQPLPAAVPSDQYECPVEIINHWPEPTSTQKRRASHNAVERRRRDTISEKIKELSILVPPDFDPASAPRASSMERQHKSVVLQRSVDYIRYLQESHYLLQKELDQLQTYDNVKTEPYPS